MSTLLDRVLTPQGEIIIITKDRFLFFFNKPRTSVMPIGFSDFGRQAGFQARYNTSDPEILQEFHEFWVYSVTAKGFESLFASVKAGNVNFAPDHENLRGRIIGFHA
jgi:hypothetical protein